MLRYKFSKSHTRTASNASLVSLHAFPCLKQFKQLHLSFPVSSVSEHHLTSVTYAGPGMTNSRASCETDSASAAGCHVTRCHASSSVLSQRLAQVTSHPWRPAFVQHCKVVQACRFFDNVVHLTQRHITNTTAVN